MYYLRIDDLRMTLLRQVDGVPVFAERNIVPGAFSEVLGELASGFKADKLDVIVSGPMTIVPSEELPADPADNAAIFNTCFHFIDNTPRYVFSNEIPALRSHLLFAVKQPTYEAVMKQFADVPVQFVSSLTPLLRHFADRYDGSSRFRVYVNCRDRFIDVFVFDGRQLAVINSFPVSTPADAVYYILGFSKTVGFAVATTPYYIVGDSSMVGDLVNHLSRFAGRVSSHTIVDEFGSTPLTVNPHITYDLAAHVLCAL